MVDRIIWWVGIIHIAAYALALGSFVTAWCFHRAFVYFDFMGCACRGIYIWRRDQAKQREDRP